MAGGDPLFSAANSARISCMRRISRKQEDEETEREERPEEEPRNDVLEQIPKEEKPVKPLREEGDDYE